MTRIGVRRGVQYAETVARVAERPHGQPSSPPVQALITRMQRAAGNQAVARLVRGPSLGTTRPLLQRLDDEDVKEIMADKARKKVYEAARTLHYNNFGISGTYKNWSGREDFDWFVKQATSVAGLLAAVKKSVDAAAAAQLRAATPSPPAIVPPQASPPASGSSSKAVPKEEQLPEAEFSDESEEEGEKQSAEKAPEKPSSKKKRAKFVPFKAPSGPPPSVWSGQAPASLAQPPSVSVASSSPQRSVNVTACTSALESWSPTAHGGRRATNLTLAEAQDVVYYAEHTYGRRDKVFVFKGAGSGEYADRVQLKIVHKTVTVGGGKKATFHITLSQNVYDQLTVGED
jgi:hypothetical protein